MNIVEKTVKIDGIFEDFKKSPAYIPENEYRVEAYTRGWMVIWTLTIDRNPHSVAAMYHFTRETSDMVIYSPKLDIVNAIITVPASDFMEGYDESYPWDIIRDVYEPIPLELLSEYLKMKFDISLFSTRRDENKKDFIHVYVKYETDYDSPCVCHVNENGCVDKIIYHPSSGMCEMLGISF